MDWNMLWSGIGGAVGVPLIGFVFMSFLPREKTAAFGVKCRKLCEGLLKQKMGVSLGDATAGRIATTLSDFATGFMQDPDDPTPPDPNMGIQG